MLRINVYAEDHGWLFEDLKRHFDRLRIEGFEILISDRPVTASDRWVALRTREAGISPDLKRTVVCIHDLFCDSEMYRPGGSRWGVREAGGLVLSHPEQRRILIDSGVPLDQISILERPLGALSAFTVRQQRSARFSVGWVGRNHWRKRLNWLIEAVEALKFAPQELHVSLIGEGLEQAADCFLRRGVSCSLYPKSEYSIFEYPRLYQKLDCVVITSSTEAGPLPLFESLATGVPVVTTPVGWASYFAKRAPMYVRLAESPAEITATLKQLRVEKEELFEKRLDIARLVQDWSLDAWLVEVLNLAGSLLYGKLAEQP